MAAWNVARRINKAATASKASVEPETEAAEVSASAVEVSAPAVEVSDPVSAPNSSSPA